MSDLQERALKRLPDASSKSLKYLDSLLIDCGFYRSLVERNAYLSRETNRDITVLADLKQPEVSRLIDELKARKQRNWKPEKDDRDDEEPD